MAGHPDSEHGTVRAKTRDELLCWQLVITSDPLLLFSRLQVPDSWENRNCLTSNHNERASKGILYRAELARLQRAKVPCSVA